MVSLKLFYNYGRLPLKFHCGQRVSWIELDHDRDWVKTEDGYHCKVCGKKLSGSQRLFCSVECEGFFNRHFRQAYFWDSFRQLVFDRDKGVCKKCGEKVSPFNFVCDHIIPLYAGGKDWYEDYDLSNFQTLCATCNREKTNEDLKKFHQKVKASKIVGAGKLISDYVVGDV